MTQIEAGSKVKVTIKRTPISEGAQKTLARLFLKDRKIAKSRRSDPKPLNPTRRGGRIWTGRPRGAATHVPGVGESCEITATLDVVRDLASVKRYVDVGPA
jgi:hypothetical protein